MDKKTPLRLLQEGIKGTILNHDSKKIIDRLIDNLLPTERSFAEEMFDGGMTTALTKAKFDIFKLN